MIDSVKRNDYNYPLAEDYTKRMKSVKQEPSIQTPVYNQSEHAQLWRSYNYSEDTAVPTYDESAVCSDALTDEADLQMLYEKGYSVDTLTGDEVAYLAAKEKQLTERAVTKSTYEPIEKKIERLKEHEDSMYRYAVEHASFSINDLYRASYTGSTGGIQNYIKEDIPKVLKYNGLDVNEGNTWAADKLMSMGMDVTADSVVKMQNTYAAIESLEVQEESDKAMEAIEVGEEPGNELLIEEEKILYTEKSMQQIVDDLTEVKDEDIQSVINEGKDVTIGNLRASMLRNTEKVLKPQEQAPQQQGQDQQSEAQGASEGKGQEQVKVDTVKQQIREIRVMLTTESARKLSEKMPLESSELQKVAEGLRAIEQTTFEDAAKKIDLALTPEVKDQIKKAMDAAKMMGQYKEVAAGTVEQSKQDTGASAITIENIHHALEAYEEVGTIPEKRFGETINKLEQEIRAFLERSELPQTTENIEVCKSLISNQMDLTSETMSSMKGTLSQINVVLDTLTPYQAAELIKEGINPYKASLSQMVQYLGDKQMPKLQQSVAEAIVALEDKGKITSDQKQSLLGLYRLIEGVKGHKEEVAGYLHKNQMPLTLEKLEEAMKYGVKQTTVDAQIDDAFGEMESISYSEQTARQKIEEATKQINEQIDVLKAIENKQLPISKEQTDKVAQLKTMLYPFIKQAVKDELGKFDGLDVMPESLKQKVEVAKKVKPEVLQLIETYKLPTTLNTIYWMDKLYEDPDFYQTLISKETLSSDEQALPETFEELEQRIQSLEEDAHSQKDQCMQQGDLSGYKYYQQIEEVVALQKKLSDHEGFYQIPFVIQGETKMVSLYINEKNKGEAFQKERIDAVISYDTKELGNIRAYISLTKDAMDYQIVGQTQQVTQRLEQEQGILTSNLDALGYRIQKVLFDTEATEKTKPMTFALKGDSQFEMIV